MQILWIFFFNIWFLGCQHVSTPKFVKIRRKKKLWYRGLILNALFFTIEDRKHGIKYKKSYRRTTKTKKKNFTKNTKIKILSNSAPWIYLTTYLLKREIYQMWYKKVLLLRYTDPNIKIDLPNLLELLKKDEEKSCYYRHPKSSIYKYNNQN